jgi:ATP-dependent helicase/nuclease subunit B
MPLVRQFLDWNRPLLAAGVEELTKLYARGRTLDLADVIVVTPGAAAGRRLLELLVERATAASLTLVPPRFVTQGELPELLYENKFPFAGDLSQELAWVEALQGCEPARLHALLPHPPERDDLDAWREVAQLLARLHRELAADNLDIPDVLRQAALLPGFNETARWRVLDELRTRYLHILDKLKLWDQQTARLYAIDNGLCRCEQAIVLVGLADMNGVLRSMLDQLQCTITAFVFAPANMSARFDKHGCLVPSAWLDAPIGLDDRQIIVADGPGDQADAVIRSLASFGGQYSSAEVTIGAVDERLVPTIQQRLEEAGLRGRFAGGTPLARSGPYQLLAALADYVERHGSDSLAAIVRHPAVEAWLRRSGVVDDILAAIDTLSAERLPAVIHDKFLKRLTDKEATARQIIEKIETLVAPLAGERRVPGDWGRAMVDVVLTIYGQTKWNPQIDAHRQIVAACERILEGARELSRLNDQLAPHITGADALRWLLDELSGGAIPPQADPAAIELLGWLELPLDDAPALILVGFNEGIVPASRNGDAFLPDTLRRQLKLEDNERRYARDAYALNVLVASRQELRVIVGRRTSAGDPLLPSRLLFATADENLAPRTLMCFKERHARPRLVFRGSVRPGETTHFDPPKPVPLAEPVTSMRVTEFRDYLACPYRYYLKHRLGLKAVADASRELDELQFGNLVHEVLAAFGESDLTSTTDSNLLSDFLLGQLDFEVRKKLAEFTWPAVGVQLELARQRLRGFARWQCDWRAQGNEIRFVEKAGEPEESFLTVDARPMHLRGRIDRIDFNPKTREWFIFDYKTSAAGKSPQQQHQRNHEWVDLQLPLYRYLAQGLGVGGIVRLGYIVLPASVEAIQNITAPWTEAELSEADAVAADVVRAVRAQKFWPPNPEPPDFGADFACIVGDDRYAVLAQETAPLEETP